MSKVFVLHRDGKPGLMLSDGIGIEHMRPLIIEFMRDFNDVNKVVQINFSDKMFMFKDEMDRLDEENLRFSSFFVDSREAFYEKLNGEMKKIMFQTGRIPNVYIAGRDEFKQEMMMSLEQAGFDKDSIIVEGGAPELSCNGGCSSCSSGC
jgi:NAD(P)H-flavin reductase